MRKYFAAFLMFLMATALPSGTSASEAKEIRAVIETTYGALEVKFFQEVAPKHVENFVKLAKEGFYDDTIFHGAVPGLLIQGGDPYTKISKTTYTGCCPDKRMYGAGGPGWTVPAEFNNIPHRRGIVSMVRFQDPNSAGSQFFIVLNDANSFDGKYTVFGEVKSGMHVVDKIADLPKNSAMPYLLNERVEMRVKIIE